MGREDYQEVRKGVLKRKFRRRLGLFIDGTGLDRATRRLDRKVDLAHLVQGVSSGLVPEVARYYTLVPYEDDARQFSFLDAVERAGLEVIVKRLPPKGVKRQVCMDVHMATDIVAYSYGHFEKTTENQSQPKNNTEQVDDNAKQIISLTEDKTTSSSQIKRLAVVLCPSRELTYAIFMSHQLGVETHLADFGLYGTSDGWKGVDRWIDLSTSETIWR